MLRKLLCAPFAFVLFAGVSQNLPVYQLPTPAPRLTQVVECNGQFDLMSPEGKPNLPLSVKMFPLARRCGRVVTTASPS